MDCQENRRLHEFQCMYLFYFLGIILLLSCAMQFSWAVRQLDLKGVQTKFFRDMGRYNQSSEQNYTVYEYSYNSRNIDLLNIVSWYIGAAVGNIFAAMLVPSFKKASIYVRWT